MLADARVYLWREDARTVLKLNPQLYDVIIAEPSNPWTVGIGSVFSREFYKIAAGRLKPGGIMAQWFHVYEMQDDMVESGVAHVQFGVSLYGNLGSRWRRHRNARFAATLADGAGRFPAGFRVERRADGHAHQSTFNHPRRCWPDNWRRSAPALPSRATDRCKAIYSQFWNTLLPARFTSASMPKCLNNLTNGPASRRWRHPISLRPFAH